MPKDAKREVGRKPSPHAPSPQVFEGTEGAALWNAELGRLENDLQSTIAGSPKTFSTDAYHSINTKHPLHTFLKSDASKERVRM